MSNTKKSPKEGGNVSVTAAPVKHDGSVTMAPSVTLTPYQSVSVGSEKSEFGVSRMKTALMANTDKDEPMLKTALMPSSVKNDSMLKTIQDINEVETP